MLTIEAFISDIEEEDEKAAAARAPAQAACIKFSSSFVARNLNPKRRPGQPERPFFFDCLTPALRFWCYPVA
ncbi:MAG: hypothetical protein DMG49_24165 [Acidobacteria bacterium]|nr:MAG: hypothetical protein DMG49_24165 [Acidobacteriota bacterium]